MHSFTRSCIFAWLTLGSLAVASESSRAAAEEAKRHFQVSKELYDDGDLSGALNELTLSYNAVPNFKLLYNMGQIYALMQNHAAALKTFQKYLADGGNGVVEAKRIEVSREIEKLRTRVGQLTITVPLDGVEIAVDDVVIGKSPLPGAITVNIGKRKVSGTLQNYFPSSKQVDVGGLDSLVVKLELQPMVSQTVVAERTPTTTAVKQTAPVVEARAFPVWVPWAVTGVLAASAVVTGIFALRATSDQQKLVATFGITQAQQNTAANLTRNWALATDILGAAAIAGGITALILTLVHAPAPAPTAVHMAPGPTGVMVWGTFE